MQFVLVVLICLLFYICCLYNIKEIASSYLIY